jgi:hypothetical protein
MLPYLSPEVIEERIFSQFIGWAWFQRIRETSSWIWDKGYFIQIGLMHRWVCKTCVSVGLYI